MLSRCSTYICMRIIIESRKCIFSSSVLNLSALRSDAPAAKNTEVNSRKPAMLASILLIVYSPFIVLSLAIPSLQLSRIISSARIILSMFLSISLPSRISASMVKIVAQEGISPSYIVRRNLLIALICRSCFLVIVYSPFFLNS